MMPSSPKAPEMVIKSYFSKYDNDGSGCLNSNEFGRICYDMGLYMHKIELDAAIHQLDKSGDGRISFNEFVEWWKNEDRYKMLEAAEKPVVKHAIAYFQKYDHDGSGSININEFKQLCTDLGWTSQNISSSLAALDKNSDGTIGTICFTEMARSSSIIVFLISKPNERIPDNLTLLSTNNKILMSFYTGSIGKDFVKVIMKISLHGLDSSSKSTSMYQYTSSCIPNRPFKT